MKNRRALGSSRKVKGTHAVYSEFQSGNLERRTHKTATFDRDRMEMRQRRDAALRGEWFGNYLDLILY